jgi:diphthamide synthase (EF-2-diphthine--ammonia ligase)
MLQNPSFEVCALLTTLTEGYDRVSMSGVREQLLDRQAKELELPLVKVWIPPTCTNAVYEERMAQAFATEPLRSVVSFAFADLFLEDVRSYREERLSQANKEGIFPLWGRDTTALALEMLGAGIRATVVCVDPKALPASCAGRAFDERFLEDLPAGVDPCGERGEFHTFVWDAPMYHSPIDCQTGEVVVRDGFVFCDVIVADRAQHQRGVATPVQAGGREILPGQG